jgi:hypothetical protein
MALVSAGWDTLHSAAALVKFSRRAAASAYLTWNISIEHPPAHSAFGNLAPFSIVAGYGSIENMSFSPGVK